MQAQLAVLLLQCCCPSPACPHICLVSFTPLAAGFLAALTGPHGVTSADACAAVLVALAMECTARGPGTRSLNLSNTVPVVWWWCSIHGASTATRRRLTSAHFILS